MSERQVTVHRVFGDACECMSGIWYLFAELLHAAFIWDFYHHFYFTTIRRLNFQSTGVVFKQMCFAVLREKRQLCKEGEGLKRG